MAASTQQRKSRADAKLDHRLVADLPFFAESNRVKKHKAAIYLAEDELTDRELCKSLNISTSTLHEWKQDADFQSVVDHYRSEIVADTLKLPIARKYERVKTLNDVHDGLLFIKATRSRRIREELAEGDSAVNATRRIFGDATPEEAASGLMVREESMSASGKKVVNYKLDSALIKAITDVEKQAAQELGQWTEQSSVEQTGGMRIEIVGIADEDMP